MVKAQEQGTILRYSRPELRLHILRRHILVHGNSELSHRNRMWGESPAQFWTTLHFPLRDRDSNRREAALPPSLSYSTKNIRISVETVFHGWYNHLIRNNLNCRLSPMMSRERNMPWYRKIWKKCSMAHWLPDKVFCSVAISAVLVAAIERISSSIPTTSTELPES